MKVAAFALGCLLILPAFAEEAGTVPAEPPPRPKVALVLSGGGARGSAHIGVLKMLEEYHVPVDLIVGTSMGSIVGGLYAAGWSSEEIEERVTTLDWGSVFVDRLDRNDETFRRKEEDLRFLIPLKMRFKDWKPYLPSAVVGGQNLELLFQSFEIEATGEDNFDQLPIPYRAVASDLATGQAVVIDKGSLSLAMRASMALPGIFPPVELDGKELADGGMAANFPIRIARALGAEIIIGVDISSPLRTKEQLGNILTRIDQVTGLLTNANKEADMAYVEPQDVIIVPELGDITFSDFAKAKETIVRGEIATREVEARLRQLSVSDDAWRAYELRHHRRPASELVVNTVIIKNTGPLNDAIVDRRINIPIGEPLNSVDLGEQLTDLYGLDVFGPINHTFTRGDDGGTLTIDVPPKPYGRNSLQFGFFMASDFKGNFAFDLAMSHLLLPVNRRGGEWRNILQFGTNSLVASEFYQPLNDALNWVFDTRVGVRRDQIDVFSDTGEALAQYIFTTTDLTAGFGRVFGNWGQVGLGGFRAWGEGHKRIGIDALPSINNDDGGLVLDFRIDTLDSITWPRHGTHLRGEYRQSLEEMGAQADGNYAGIDFGQSFTFGKNTMFFTAEMSTVVSGAAVIDNVFFLGGFLRLSGLEPNQLIAERGGLARVMYYRELSAFDLGSLTQRMYVGISLETGNVYDRGDPVTVKSLIVAGSVFVGADTFLGPAYFGYGRAQDGQDSIYLIIGQRF
jgi:NTE family protein